jgi:hypothetical protein
VKRGAAALVALIAVFGGACGGSKAAVGVSGEDIKPIAAAKLPATLLGLEVHEEDMKSTIAQTEDSYVDAVSLFSLRGDNLVQATLQVSHLTKAFDYRSARQRANLADKIGGARATTYRVGRTTVYVTQGLRQRISVWFSGRTLLVLSARDDLAKPRGLLRAVVELNL